MTIREALAEGSAALGASGADTPSLDAALLLAEVLHTSRSSLIVQGPEPLPGEALAAFRALLARREEGECVAYILGRKEFRGLDFTVGPDVLTPRPDTETLVEAALERISALGPGEPLRTLDLCTGSGAVAIALKHERPFIQVWGTDLSAAALDIARINARRLLSGAEPGALTLLQGDLFAALENASLPGQSGLKFHLITANPPYVPREILHTLPMEVQREPVLALDGGPGGMDIIRRIIAGAGEYLFPGGALLLEADPGQMDALRGLLENQGFQDIRVWADLAGQGRVIGALSKARE
jgi:release factor glutamine methyltransferase